MSFNEALFDLAKTNNTDVVSLLLSDGRSDPTALNSGALWEAASRGHTAIVKLLLEDGRADPTALGSKALWCAAHYGRYDVVRLLLADGRADPTAEDSAALQGAAFRGYDKIIKLLLADGRADPTVRESLVLRQAVRHNPADNGSDFLLASWRSVVRRGNIPLLKLLLMDGRADPAAQNSEALRKAARNGHMDIVKLLMEDGRSDPTAQNSKILESTGSLKIINFLLESSHDLHSQEYNGENKRVAKIISVFRKMKLDKAKALCAQLRLHMCDDMVGISVAYSMCCPCFHEHIKFAKYRHSNKSPSPKSSPWWRRRLSTIFG